MAQYAGTGIGLAICKAIADRYGWMIGVRSRSGEGATFTVTLPTAGDHASSCSDAFVACAKETREIMGK